MEIPPKVCNVCHVSCNHLYILKLKGFAVDFKFSKRKGSDEPVQLLHKLIFGKRIKVWSQEDFLLRIGVLSKAI